MQGRKATKKPGVIGCGRIRNRYINNEQEDERVIKRTFLQIKVGRKAWSQKGVPQARSVRKVVVSIEFTVTSSQLNYKLMRS